MSHIVRLYCRYGLECACSSFIQAGKPLLHMAAKGGNIQLVDWLIEEQGFDVHQWIGVSTEGQPGTKPLPMYVCQCVVVELLYVCKVQ